MTVAGGGSSPSDLSDPCLLPVAEVDQHGVVEALEFVGYDKCIQLEPPRTFRGAWLHEFEASLFFEGVEAMPDGVRTYTEADTWLDIDADDREDLRRRGFDCARCAFVIEFIGRKSSQEGNYGHMGGADHVILLDRIVSIRQVIPPRRPEPEEWNEID